MLESAIRNPATAKCARTYRRRRPVTSFELTGGRVRSMRRGGARLGGAGSRWRSCRRRGSGRRGLRHGRRDLIANRDLVLLIGFDRSQPRYIFLVLLIG